MMSRGQANTRDRDFADVVSLSRAHPVEGQRLRDTIERIAKHRGHDVLILRDALGDLSERRQSSRTALRQRSGLNTLPESFAALVAETLRFVDPLIDDGRRARRWIPDEGRWSA